ncbi:hypothetical protein QBC38DRAFT_238636 [Podospora fimiseda]|uniref:Uncharacterized protein n=1 Tax=Podospora fimiseda TaxID=252190 RepID=A0AAN7BMP7_9PEZI|nr:hypothetical protein QBC38DRAFT_238636 [Podospora fimiseda]
MPSIFGRSGSGASPVRAKTGLSIRGTISGPIPIPSPDDDDEFPIRNPGSARLPTFPDDEFPIRRPGTGIAQPLPAVEEPSPSSSGNQPERHEEKQKQLQQPRDHEAERISQIESGKEQRQVTPPDLSRDVVPEQPSNPPPAPPSIASTPANPASRPTSRSPQNQTSTRRSSPHGVSPSRVLPGRRATNPALSTIRYSTISDATSKHSTQSRDAPQRKKSTLRSALGRLFGRGKKKNGGSNRDTIMEVNTEAEALGSTAQHRSDPVSLSRPPTQIQISPKRTASLPINELDRPLRSHSIGPDDIMAIESARNSLQLQAEGGTITAAGRRRAATTTSRMMFQKRLKNPEWGAGLSPRPSSAQGRAATQQGAHIQSDDPNEIGRAITSDSGGGFRRRSRSLSGLQEFASNRQIGRRRSDEIRFWRESYDPSGLMSPLSSNAPEDIDDTGMADVSVPDSPAIELPPKTPPQPFNFGLLSKEMVGMKITSAANMDTRLVGLESRTHRLERVVNQLCHSVPGFKAPFGEAASSSSQTDLRSSRKRASSQPGSFAFTSDVPPAIPAEYAPVPPVTDTLRPSSSRRSLETDTVSQVSFGEAPTFIGSLHPPSSSATQAQSLAATAPAPALTPAPPLTLNRPNSNSTVRGATSLPTMGRGGDASGTSSTSLSDDHLTTTQLRAELEIERAARQDLEAQVKKLSERLNTLSSTVFAMVRGPSESRSAERLSPLPSVSSSSPLLSPPKMLVVPPPPVVQEQLSVFEESDSEDEEEEEETFPTETTVAAADEEEEDFQTPSENIQVSPFKYHGAFGEELRPDDLVDDDGRKKAARTLSLSQLTMGKGQQQQQNQI